MGSNIEKSVEKYTDNQRTEEQLTSTKLGDKKNARDVAIQQNVYAKKSASVLELDALGKDLAALPLLKNKRCGIMMNKNGDLMYFQEPT